MFSADQCLHQRTELAGGDPNDVSLQDDRAKGPIDQAAGLHPCREEAVLPHPGDGQGEMAPTGGKYPPTLACLVDGPRVRAVLAPLGADDGGNLGCR
jgi:hypothetical protein